MKVLLTGASGFVGSHILDALDDAGFDLTVLLRPTSDTRFIADRLPRVRTFSGSLDDADSLKRAMRGVDGVVHCAGKTKVLRVAEYDRANRDGTRRVVEAVNACQDTVRHLVHISSLAASGPGGTDRPARENDPPRPISAYGRSKRDAEQEVVQRCQVPWTVLRPGAVYGPRDRDFLGTFRMARRGVVPSFGRHTLPLSLVFGPDVAEAVRCCIGREEAKGAIYHVAAEPPTSSSDFPLEIARVAGVRPLRLPVPFVLLRALCAGEDLVARLTGRVRILSRDKLAEMSASGWVGSVERIRRDLGFVAPTALAEGIRRTLIWYRDQGWL